MRIPRAKADIPSYPLQEKIKVPAGWLIEMCGWKGKRFGDIGIHEKQALVLVNYGEGKGDDLLKLARQIETSVKDKFGIDLQPEVKII